jgi:hypothetical protein
MTSPDGITWTAQTAAANNDWVSVTYGGGLFVAVATSGTAANRVMTSPDGITWTAQTVAALLNKNWLGITYGDGLFVAVSNAGTGNRVMSSPDGTTWTAQTSSSNDNWTAVSHGNGVFVAKSAALPNKTMVSGCFAPTVSFDTNGGTGTMSSQTGSSATNLPTNTFTRTGYNFAGWNTAADGSGTAYADGASYPFTSGATLYAQWAVVATTTAPSSTTTAAPTTTAPATATAGTSTTAVPAPPVRSTVTPLDLPETGNDPRWMVLTAMILVGLGALSASRRPFER